MVRPEIHFTKVTQKPTHAVNFRDSAQVYLALRDPTVARRPQKADISQVRQSDPNQTCVDVERKFCAFTLTFSSTCWHDLSTVVVKEKWFVTEANLVDKSLSLDVFFSVLDSMNMR